MNDTMSKLDEINSMVANANLDDEKLALLASDLKVWLEQHGVKKTEENPLTGARIVEESEDDESM